MPKQDVPGIIRQVAAHRSRQRRIPLNRRRILVKKVKGADFRVNRHEIEVDVEFATTGNPFDMMDRILNAVEDFDRKLWEERVRKINEVKSSVMKWMDYLERALQPAQYREFVESFLPDEVVDITALAPDSIYEELDLEQLALIAEAERLTDKGIYFRA